MESLLRWGIENSAPREDGALNPPTPRQDLDPAIIDMILGKSDAVLMKEDIAVAVDESQPEANRIDALDHLEMLIEQIDNANNLEKLQMWTPLQKLLTSTQTTTAIKVQALWVIGTALQNNPAAQDAYGGHDPLPVLTAFLTPSPSSTAHVRGKVLYALSGLLKHNAPAVAALSRPDVDGWDKLREALQDPDLPVRRKALFLLSTLLIPTLPPTLAQSETVHANSHAATLSDPGRTDTSTSTLTRIGGARHFGRPKRRRRGLSAWFEAEQTKDPDVVSDRWGLSKEEFEALVGRVAEADA
ncbi:nucleotide exchange factor Fes1-domain-containing protein [Mycena filopes]|nr:nucleotide exchange factor Fes1-domain-containing protein [Mycena filopes]